MQKELHKKYVKLLLKCIYDETYMYNLPHTCNCKSGIA